MREGIERLIEYEPDLTLTGSAATAEDALPQLQSAPPDVALVDLQLSGMTGIELIHQVRALALPVRLLVISAHEEDLYGGRALRAGAYGYMMKHDVARHVADAVRHVARGERHISASLRRHLLRDWLETQGWGQPIDEWSDAEIAALEQIGWAESGKTSADASRSAVPAGVREALQARLAVSSDEDVVRDAVRWVTATAR